MDTHILAGRLNIMDLFLMNTDFHFNNTLTMYWSHVDHWIFISCLNSQSDGTHSLFTNTFCDTNTFCAHLGRAKNVKLQIVPEITL